jgi:hypothetical protein
MCGISICKQLIKSVIYVTEILLLYMRVPQCCWQLIEFVYYPSGIFNNVLRYRRRFHLCEIFHLLFVY